MTAAVSTERWLEAQTAEGDYWRAVRSSGGEVVRLLAEKVAAAAWAAKRLPQEGPPGEWVEIGIGPLGVGCVHFLPGASGRTIVGVEPLPLLDPGELELPQPLASTVAGCRSNGYVHVSGAGESIPLEDGRFALAACYNVLDHVRDPAAVLRETQRILRPGGTLLLGCDAVSLLSLLRFRVYVARRYPGVLGVRAHPFRFRAPELDRLVQEAGFRLVATSERRPRLLRDLAGHAQRILLLAEKGAP